MSGHEEGIEAARHEYIEALRQAKARREQRARERSVREQSGGASKADEEEDEEDPDAGEDPGEQRCTAKSMTRNHTLTSGSPTLAAPRRASLSSLCSLPTELRPREQRTLTADASCVRSTLAAEAGGLLCQTRRAVFYASSLRACYAEPGADRAHGRVGRGSDAREVCAVAARGTRPLPADARALLSAYACTLLPAYALNRRCP
eukprot:3394006-Rhodomonas_salina.1